MTESKICTCPSGDGSLVHPCPAHPAVEQAGGDERAAFELFVRKHCGMPAHIAVNWDAKFTNDAWEGWKARAALAQPSQSQYEASFEEWLANELEGEDGQPVPAAVCDIALARRAFNHWPKLEHPAKVGGVRFSAGVSSRLVVEAAQRLYEFESTPEKEAERPEVVGYRSKESGMVYEQDYGLKNPEALTTVAECERIVGALRADRDSWAEQAEQRLADWDEMRKERDAALARVAELELKLDKSDYADDNDRIHMRDLAARAIARAKVFDDGSDGADAESARSVVAILRELLAVGPAQAQHSVPEGWMLVECGIWTQEQVDEMQKTVTRFRNSEFVDDRALAMAVADAGQCKAPEISLAELLAAAPGKEVGHE